MSGRFPDTGGVAGNRYLPLFVRSPVLDRRREDPPRVPFTILSVSTREVHSCLKKILKGVRSGHNGVGKYWGHDPFETPSTKPCPSRSDVVFLVGVLPLVEESVEPPDFDV